MIGVDLESVTRFEHMTEEGLKRIFTKKEMEYAKEFENWQEHLTGFFCVKEAFVKAADFSVDYLQIEVLHSETGKPYVNQTPYIKAIMKKLFVKNVEVSISHCKQFSIANVWLTEN